VAATISETTMPTPLVRAVERAVELWQPREIWLFGSRARGTEHAEGDWDLLIVVPDDTSGIDDPRTKALLRRIDDQWVDAVLCDASGFDDYRDVPNTLSYEAAHRGIRIYAR
jgi:uncharacterized protein